MIAFQDLKLAYRNVFRNTRRSLVTIIAIMLSCAGLILFAGYVAWAVGFVIGILDKIPGAPAGLVSALRPEVLFSFFAGFVVYFALAKMGLEPPLVPLESPAQK